MPIRKKGKHLRHADQSVPKLEELKKLKLENHVPKQINLFTFNTVERKYWIL